MVEKPPATGLKSPGLSVPIVIWGPQPPDNQICVLRVLPDGETIITGAENGHLIVWQYKQGLVPKQLMIGHEFRITAISQTSNLANNTRFISTSSDGLICLWEIQDGRCIDSATSINVHRYIQPYTYKSSRHTRATRLFCIGDYCDVQVMDPQDLTITFSISSRVEPDWIAGYSLVTRRSKDDQLIGVTMSGIVKVWTLLELETKDHSNALYEKESKRLDIEQVRSCTFNTINDEFLLIIGAHSWMIININDLTPIVQWKSSCELIQCVSGFVVDVDKVAVGFSDESIKVFQVPITCLPTLLADEFFKGAIPTKNYFDQDEPFVVAAIPGIEDSNRAWMNDSCFECHVGQTNEMTAGKPETTIVRTVRQTGNVLVWKMPPFDQQFMRAVPALRNLPFKFKGTHQESLMSIWKTLHDNDDVTMPVLNSDTVCCSLFVTSQGKLFLGRSDGAIIMTYACETLSRQWLNVPSERPNMRKLSGHRAAVRAMFYPHEHDARYDAQVFLSGADDYSTIVWNINNGAKLHRFCVHGGPVTGFLIPPSNCSKMVVKCVAAMSKDNSIALLNIRDNKCTLLASKHPHPVAAVKWRPLDDFMLVKLSDGSVYVWQMETANLDRIVTGLLAEDVMAACDEQIGLEEGTDESQANNAVQLIRALKNKNMDAVKQKMVGSVTTASTPMNHEPGSASTTTTAAQLGSPMSIIPLPGCVRGAHMVQFEVSSLIAGILHIDASAENVANARKDEAIGISGLSRKLTWQFEANLYLDVARLMLSMLHAWGLDDNLDEVCEKKLSLHKPKHEVYFGNISRQGQLSVGLPSRFTSDFEAYAKRSRWQESHSLNTNHLLSIIATSNTLMAMRNTGLQLTRSRRSVAAPNSDVISAGDQHQVKQGWSLVAALHCALLPDHVRPRSSYAAPSIEMLARRWQDSCMEIREAAQALLIRELGRLGADGRRRLIESWAPFLPPLLDDALSIFGSKLQSSIPTQQQQQQKPPEIPPRKKNAPPNVEMVSVVEAPPTAEGGESGVQQVRRNQATAIILLGVIGAEFGEELNRADLTRATAVSLLELLVAAPSKLIPVHSPLRRAAIDLLGRGFVHWEPHLEISKVVLGLLDLAGSCEKNGTSVAGAPLSAIEDAIRTSRQALSLIALARPPALLTALSMEVARYNAAAQHQTIQHTVVSPLLKSRVEVLRIVEELCEKRYNEVVAMMLPVGDVLVHCLDVSMLKHKSLADVFPPITKFNMVGYCAATRRIAFGGQNGVCVVHELRATKTHSLTAHSGPIASVAFNEDGKYLATYGAQDGKINFFQTSQTFLGMGQNQMKLAKSQAAPTVSMPLSPTGKSFRPKLVWTQPKHVSLMLPEGREQRFSV